MGRSGSSAGAQVPAEYSRLVGEDIFLAGREASKPPEEVIPKARAVPLLTSAEINKLAARGEVEACTQALRQHARAGSALNVVTPLTTLLDQVKESLRDPKAAAPRAESLLRICDTLLAAIEDCLPPEHTQRGILTARALNRRGDALLLLGKPGDALEAFNAALERSPDDAYIIYNRGVALLQLDRKDEAKAEFTKVISARNKQPGARKLASEALAAME
jgi:tetratricopeptide (TPR) repeat protein